MKCKSLSLIGFFRSLYHLIFLKKKTLNPSDPGSQPAIDKNTSDEQKDNLNSIRIIVLNNYEAKVRETNFSNLPKGLTILPIAGIAG